MKKIKILVALLLISVLIFAFFAGKQGGEEQKQITLKIGTNAEYPPFEFKENGEFKGIDMDLARMIAQRMGAKYEIIDMDFDSLIPSLVSKKIDMAIAAITITEDRKKVVDFSMPYYTANQSIIAKKDSNIEIKSVEDLAKYTIGSQNGTTGQIYIDDNFIKTGKMPKENFKKYATNIEAITDMLNGNVDLVIIDDGAAQGYIKLKPIKILYIIDTGENYGIAFQKDSPYTDKVNSILKDILNSDDWVQLIKKYF